MQVKTKCYFEEKEEEEIDLNRGERRWNIINNILLQLFFLSHTSIYVKTCYKIFAFGRIYKRKLNFYCN